MPVPLQPCCNCAYEMSARLGQMWNECGVVKVRGRSLEECHCVHTCDYIHVCKKSVIFPALIFAICARAEWHRILTPYAKFHLKERINVKPNSLLPQSKVWLSLHQFSLNSYHS